MFIQVIARLVVALWKGSTPDGRPLRLFDQRRYRLSILRFALRLGALQDYLAYWRAWQRLRQQSRELMRFQGHRQALSQILFSWRWNALDRSRKRRLMRRSERRARRIMAAANVKYGFARNAYAMSTTRHTAIPMGMGANAAGFEAPLGQLDQAIANLVPYDAKQAPYNAVGNGIADDSAALQAWLTAIPAGGRGYLPAGIYMCSTATSGVVLQLLNKAFVTIEGAGRGSIIRFQNVTATDGLRIDGCTVGTFRDFQVQVAGTSVITNAIQYTCGSPGSAEDGTFDRVFVSNQNQTGRWAYDVASTSGSAVITSAQAVFAAGDVGGTVGLRQRGATTPILATTISSVATRTATVNNGGVVTAVQTTIPMLAAIPSAPAGAYTVLINSEIMLVTAGFQTATLTVTRGYAGTTTATHVDASTVTTYQATLAANATWTNDGTALVNGLAWLYIQTPTSAVMHNGIAVGTDHPGASNMDVSDTTFSECQVSGSVEANWRLGNGTAGNLLNVSHFGCMSNVGVVGVLMAGMNENWVGGWVGETGADFYVCQSAAGPLSILGVRSENSGQFLEHGLGANGLVTAIRDVEIWAFRGADTVPIRYLGNYGLTLESVAIHRSVVGGAVNIALSPNNALPLSYVAINVSTDGAGSPHPVQAGNLQRTIIGGVSIDPATTLTVSGGNTWGTIIDGVVNPSALAYSVSASLASAIAPNAGVVQYYNPPPLTASQTVAAPLNPKLGEELVFQWTQNAIGGWVINYNAIFKISGTGALATTPNTVSIDRFLYDGSVWRIVSRMTGMTL